MQSQAKDSGQKNIVRTDTGEHGGAPRNTSIEVVRNVESNGALGAPTLKDDERPLLSLQEHTSCCAAGSAQGRVRLSGLQDFLLRYFRPWPNSSGGHKRRLAARRSMKSLGRMSPGWSLSGPTTPAEGRKYICLARDCRDTGRRNKPGQERSVACR